MTGRWTPAHRSSRLFQVAWSGYRPVLGVTLGPATGRRLAEYVTTGRRPAVLEPFRFDRLRG